MMMDFVDNIHVYSTSNVTVVQNLLINMIHYVLLYYRFFFYEYEDEMGVNNINLV